MKTTTLGIDLAKSTFRLLGVDARGTVVLRRQLTRRQLLPFLARLSPCLIGMAAMRGRYSRSVNRVVRSTKVPIAELPRPTIRSPSQ
jgi:transposase